MLNDIVALYSSDPALFAGSVFLLGLLVGSFLNVVIYRLPIMLEREWRSQAAEALSTGNRARRQEPPPAASLERFTLSTPRSACPNCKAPITALQNIPVVSWLVLRGRCASCKAKISARYPLVELATGVLSAWVAWHFGFGAPAACALLVTWALIALTGIDIDHQLLPDNITLPLMWAGLLAAVAIRSGAGCGPARIAERRHHRRGGRVHKPVAGISCIQARDRQGRHGVWRLQAVCGAGRLAGLEGPAPGDRACPPPPARSSGFS